MLVTVLARNRESSCYRCFEPHFDTSMLHVRLMTICPADAFVQPSKALLHTSGPVKKPKFLREAHFHMHVILLQFASRLYHASTSAFC